MKLAAFSTGKKALSRFFIFRSVLHDREVWLDGYFQPIFPTQECHVTSWSLLVSWSIKEVQLQHGQKSKRSGAWAHVFLIF